MKVHLVTAIGSFLIGGFTSLMMVRSTVKADREYALQQFSAVADQIGTVSENAEVSRYEYCLHD